MPAKSTQDRPTQDGRTPDPLMSRLAAFEILQDILKRNKALDEALIQSRAYGALSGPDRAFAAYIARTALRRLGQIDELIRHCVKDPLPRKARPVNDVLRVGIAQLFFAATADHAQSGWRAGIQ